MCCILVKTKKNGMKNGMMFKLIESNAVDVDKNWSAIESFASIFVQNNGSYSSGSYSCGSSTQLSSQGTTESNNDSTLSDGTIAPRVSSPRVGQKRVYSQISDMNLMRQVLKKI